MITEINEEITLTPSGIKFFLQSLFNGSEGAYYVGYAEGGEPGQTFIAPPSREASLENAPTDILI